jgi:hypothetical protein
MIWFSRLKNHLNLSLEYIVINNGIPNNNESKKLFLFFFIGKQAELYPKSNQHIEHSFCLKNIGFDGSLM